MRRPLLALVALFSLSMLLAACGSDDPVDVKGDGYSYTAPGGWEDVTGDADAILDALTEGGAEITTEDIRRARYDSIVIDDATTGNFRTHFSVARLDGIPEGVTSRAVADQAAKSYSDPQVASQFIPRDFEVALVEGSGPTPIRLGDEEGYGIEYTASGQGAQTQASQIYAVVDGAGYVMTLTSAQSAFGDARPDLDSIIDSFRFD